ncbi:DUF983 domain-containing protein [Bauldia sp.]|uniref:DUF983 domain-containing protein n=1 Tax=Bauldia sp. TaxID=2575872 RepID=UPI003BA9EE9E
MSAPEENKTWQADSSQNELGLPKRPVWRSMVRGFLGRCPHCGKGALFRGYLKPVSECAVCGEDMSHQRADDAPPYFTILIVGHIVVPVMVTVALATELSVATHMAIWLPLTLAMCLALLRPIKGTIIALQWALYMHGFEGRGDPDAMPQGFLRSDSA